MSIKELTLIGAVDTVLKAVLPLEQRYALASGGAVEFLLGAGSSSDNGKECN